MFNVLADARRLEEENTRLRCERADLLDDRRKARAEITRLHTELTRLADHLDQRAEECNTVGELVAWDAAHGAATSIRRILERSKP